MSDDLVKRYSLDQFARFDGELHHADMEPCENGDWVSYADYAKSVDRIKELEAKLAKAVEAIEFWSQAQEPEIDAAINLMQATLAELKG